MGITARGAWEAVKRHFREIDVDIGKTPFSAVGVGDMSGDVFGNGMLRENTTRLLAAFDHRDIFIDPDPDPKASFRRAQAAVRAAALELAGLRQEIDFGGRRRLSARVEGNPAFSPAAQKLFGVAEAVTPQELMKAILKAPVDLLFFGGIGTYVRSSSESDEAAGDRANDAIRVSGAESALQGDRRGRQPRHDPARPHRGGARRHPAQHRRHRQFRRRQHVRRRGQHQDRLEPAAARRRADAGSAQRAARRDDRRGRAPGAAQQLSADAGALAGAAARAGGPRFPTAADANAGNARAARPRGGIPARRDGDRRAPQAQSGADAAGTGGAARLCQALALQRTARQRGAGRSLSRARARALFPQGNVGALRRRAARAPAAARDHRHATRPTR